MTLTAAQRQALLLQLLSDHLLGKCSQGELLRTLRKDVLGFSQTRYAEFTGVSRRTLSDIEQDRGSPAQAVINKVFKPFGLKAGLIPAQPQITEKLLAEREPKP